MIHAFGPFELDDVRYELRRDGKLVAVQRRAFDLLAHLVRRRGAVVTRRDLLANVWDGATVTKDAIAHAVLAARNALGEHANVIETVRGRGYRLAGAIDARERHDVAPAGDSLVARCEAVSTLHAAFAHATRRQGTFVRIEGAPGVGKTRLLEEVTHHTGGARVLVATCTMDATALAPLRVLLAELRRTTSFGGALAALLETRTGGWPGDVVVDELVALFERRRACEPLVLAFDDLDLADEATIAVVEALAPRLVALPVVIVVTVTRGSMREAPAQRIVLEPFTREELAVYLERATHAPVGDGAVDDLFCATRGNPFLLSVVHAPERATAIAAWLARHLPPARVRALVAGEIDPAFAQPLVRDALRALYTNVAPFRPPASAAAVDDARQTLEKVGAARDAELPMKLLHVAVHRMRREA